MPNLSLISENPFRTLGVYSNSSPAEIVANCDDMEAYLSIGQSIQFDLDLNNLLPKLNRTEQSVQQAKTQINLPKDKLKHALFWFVKDASSAHALNYLKKGDFENIYDVFDIEDSFASRINKAVASILQDDLGTAIANITEMIHDDDDLGLRDEFVRAICGDAFSISEEELAHLYIDTLLVEMDITELIELFEEYGVSAEDDEYLSDKAVEDIIRRINAEIVKAKAVEKTSSAANLRAGRTLVRNTKADLKAVADLLGDDSIKYQMTADELANTILQCGINYYNNTDDDRDEIDNAMELQKYACQIAVGKMCKDRCDRNLAILKRQKEKNATSADISIVVQAIKSFQIKSDSIDNAGAFVSECKPHLDNIKKKLGSTNDLYLKLSNTVASNALGMLITAINELQEKHSYLMVLHKSDIEVALSVMSLIEGLDMTSSMRSRFNTNNATLRNIKRALESTSQSSSSYGATSLSSSPVVSKMMITGDVGFSLQQWYLHSLV